MDLIQVLNDTVATLAGSPWVYFVVVLVCLIDGFFPPIPSETVVVAAAAVSASTGSPHMLLLVAAAALGAMAGDNIAFEAGRRIGLTRFRWMRRPRVVRTVEWASRGLDRRGALLIFTARYIPVGRIAVNMTAGATRYPRRRFIPLSAVAGLTWAVYSTVIGLVAGHWMHDQPLLAVVVAIVFAAVVGAAVDLVIRWLRGRGGRRRADVAVDPGGDADDLVSAQAMSSEASVDAFSHGAGNGK
ncbi:DedA family protein [Agromyces laixinhei]|uniref:DedA family protein n=1 Tax=Agromyces laixinhei TaxID=2585717 RepID=UPI0012EEB0C9|nr:VTT domain-containing protein [Agromyces laixinhei]